MKRNLIQSVGVLLIVCLFIYMFLPTLNYGFIGLPIVLIIGIGPFYLASFVPVKGERNSVKNRVFPAVFWGCFVYVLLVPFMTSSTLFKSLKYRDLIGEITTGQDFSTQVSPISTDEIRIVDRSIAYKVGDKVLGTQPSLGSQVELGDFAIQKVNGKLYWVAPLLHSGFFKWINNKSGTEGYVMVSATNERDVKLVQNVNGNPVKIKYQRNAYFSDNLSRHIYSHGYATQGFTDFTFEIDDSGNPFWVVTLFEKRIGFSGEDATGVLLVNVATGEMEEYSIEDAPLWVDRIQPASFILDQLDDWGEYVHGVFNFSNQDKLTTTNGISLVYGENNNSFWYTGLTSVGSDEGTVGFILVNTRTKESIWYKQIGATESAAQYSAMGKVQEKRYSATFPITYNINGVPTYVMSLKDQAGLIKMIAMVSVEDYTIVGVGNTLKETLRSYKNALNSTGANVVPSSSVDIFTIDTEVLRISSDIRNGNTFYYLILKGYENKIFIGSTLISNEFPISQSGDSVFVKYDEGNNELVDIIEFSNKTFQFKETVQGERIENTHSEAVN